MNAAFDTNIVIDLLAGRTEAAAVYDEYERAIISRIVWMEVLIGCDDDASTRAFLERRFEIFPLDATVADRAITLRRDHRLKLPDAIVWATALVTGATFVTRNTKDFKASMASVRVPYRN